MFSNTYVPLSWGTTLLCLIPKTENAHMASHFRPLRLCQTHYRIITKTLVNRIKPHLPSIISPFQGAFIPGRHSSNLFIMTKKLFTP